MITFITIIHVLDCIFLILVVLAQQAKAADWSGAFGGGGSQASFGQRSQTSALEKATTISAVIFMLTSLALTIMISRPGNASVIHEGAKQAQPAAPVTPPPAPSTPSNSAAPAGSQPAPAQPAPQPKP